MRLVLPLLLLCSAVLAWSGWDALLTYGSRPADGGQLAPLPLRLALGGGLAALGGAIALGAWAYARCYVARIDAVDADDALRVTLAGFVRGRQLHVRPGDVVSSQFRQGRYDNGAVSGAAPWYTVRLRDQRLPLIVDAQGEFLDREALGWLTTGRAREGGALRPREPRPAGRGRRGQGGRRAAA